MLGCLGEGGGSGASSSTSAPVLDSRPKRLPAATTMAARQAEIESRIADAVVAATLARVFRGDPSLGLPLGAALFIRG